MSKVRSQLIKGLKELHLPAIRESFEEIALQAESESLSYEQYLLELVEREKEVRWDNRVYRLLRNSRLPLEKKIQNFEMKRLPKNLVNKVRMLLEGSFLERNENALIFGCPGSGKTHVIAGIGQELIQKGYPIYFSSCSMLVQDLLLAKKELKLGKLIKKLSKYKALIIDDIGYVQQSREEMEVLFTLLSERYEKGSVMITSNLPFSQWNKIFKDTLVTEAAVDRVIHHSVILEMNLPSYRLEKAKQKSELELEKKQKEE